MVLYEEIPEGITEFYNSWKADRDAWLARAKLYQEYYFTDVDDTGTLYNRRQLQNIKDNTNLPASANFIYPIVNQRLASMVKKKPSFQVVTSSSDDKYKQYAFTIDKAVFSLLRNSQSLSKVESHCQDMLVQGMSVLGWDDEDVYLPGQFQFGLKYYPNHEVILDAGSRLKEGSDMRGYFLEKEISKDYAQFKFGKILDDINQYYSTEENQLNLTIDNFGGGIQSGMSPHRSIGLGQGTIFWKRYYDRIFTTMYFVPNPETQDIEFLFKENYFPEQIPFVFGEEDSLVVGKEVNMFVRRSDMLADKLILQTLIPVTQLPSKATYFDWGGRPYKSYGMIHREIGKQDSIDKILQLLLMNGILQNNAGWTAAENNLSPAQKKIWSQAASDPRVIKTFNPVVINDKLIVPTRDIIPPLSNFYPEMLVMLKNSMEYSTSHDPAVAAGLTTEGGKIDVFSSLQQYQNARMERVELSTDQVNYTMEYLGGIAIEYLLATMKPDQRYVFLDPVGGKINEITIFPEMIKDFKLTKYKLIATASEAHPSQKVAMATEMFKIAQTTQEPTDRNLFIKKAFDLLDMRGFDELQEELSEVRKLQSTVQQLSDEVKEQMELRKQARNAEENAKTMTKVMGKYIQIVESLVDEAARASKKIEIDILKEEIKKLKGSEAE
jgi:hypothetical protein